MDPSAELTLVDAFVPRLTAGKYVLTATQTLQVAAKDGGEETVTRLDTKTFFVQGPRFVLAPDEIYARFPPDGHHGPYHATIPHVVFRRKALPWERTLDAGIGSDDEPPDPWLALLLFEEKELADAPFRTCRLEEVARPPAPIRGPAIELDPWEEGEDAEARQCTTLDISLDLFRRVAPRRRELRWLAHARLAATRHKEDLYGIGDGWFSVVLANRLPAEGKRNNLAVLVSLEGHLGLLGEDAPDLPRDVPVRLVVLDKWAFTSEGLTFEERLRRLYEGKDPWLRASDGRDVDDPQVATALSLGYAPLPHGLRDGSRTVSWFRGPFVPVDVPAATLPPIFANPDEALRYDPGTGMLDASYAGAWQLGRLLALQGQEFARALAQSEGGHVAAALTDAAERSFADFDPAEPPAAQAARRAARLEQANRLYRDDLMVALALEWTA